MNTEKFFFVQKNADRGLRPRRASVSKANNPRHPLLLPFSLVADEARVQVGACVRASNTSNSFNTNLLSVFIPSSLHFDRGFVLAAKRERIHKDVYSSFFFVSAQNSGKTA